MNMRFFIRLSYKGTAFHGWQIQQNAPTVQAELNAALSTVFGKTIETIGAGRTDTGVHARNYIAHFDSEKLIETDNLSVMVYHLNGLLPNDIAVHALAVLPDKAHARFDATERTYKYYIDTCKNPFTFDYAAFFPYNFDVEKMNDAAKLLLEYSDFTSFAKLHADTKTNNCRILQAYWEVQDGQLIFTITADRFLRNMVRAIVGTLIEVGRGKITLTDFRQIIEQKNRCASGASVPAKGLCFEAIKYPYMTP